jgi:hypothetical protein
MVDCPSNTSLDRTRERWSANLNPWRACHSVRRQLPVRRFIQVLCAWIAFNAATFAHPVETPNDAETIREVRKNLMSWKSKLVAFRVQVQEVQFESRGQPILKVSVGGRGATESFWIASLVAEKFSPGNELLVLGMMTRSSAAPSSTKLSKLVDEPFMVLGFCFLNMTENWGAAQRNFESLCDEWFKRRMPDIPTDP